MPVACDDDDVCNGRYECLDGFCRQIAPPVGCDDSLYCTLSRCEPSTGRCTHEPDDAYCDVGMRCDADRGCVERCALEPCTIATQCGCASDQTCGPVGSAGACVPRGGTNEGNRCTSTEDCAAGLVCTSLGTGDGDRCSRPCDDGAECDGDTCLVQLGYETVLGNGDRFGRCEQVCDPVDSRGCGTSQLCLIVGSGRLATLCVDQGSAGTGQSCLFDTDCVRNHLCVRYSNGEFCGELCHTNADCAAGRTCYDFTTPLSLRGERLGVCG